MKPLPNWAFQAGRAVNGTVLLIAPERKIQPWLQAQKLTGRALGIRDIILATATTKAEASSIKEYRLLLAIGIAADLSDCLILASRYRSRRHKRTLAGSGLAGLATVNGLLLLRESYQPDPSLIP